MNSIESYLEVYLGIGIWLLAMGLVLWSTYLAWRHSKQGPPHLDAPFALYPISILKPLKGADEGLRDNLETFFRLDYPEYEILFSVAEKSDPAYRVVHELIQAYPGVDAKCIVGQAQLGINPKVNNLILSYQNAKYDWLLISDSNVRVEKDYLKRLAAHIETGVGVITSVVAGWGGIGLGGGLEAMYLNTFYARGMHLTSALGHPCVVGKSMMFRRSEAERFGGMRALANYLAEDYMTGMAMIELGHQVVIASDPIPQYLGRYSFKNFWLRQIRWGRIRKAQARVPFMMEPFLGSIFSGILGGVAFSMMWKIPIAEFLVFHLLIWSACDFWVMRTLKVSMEFYTPLLWFLREFLSLLLWIHIASGNTVNWRGKKLVVQSGGLLKPL